MNLSTLLKTMKQAYPFHIHHQVPTDSGYIVDTNWGPKLVTIYHDDMLVHWSFLWREELARKGLRLIDRFLRTKDGAPFASVGKEYIVVRDYIRNQPFSVSPLDTELTLSRPLGQILGTMHLAVKELDQKYEHHINLLQWKQFQRNHSSFLYAQDKIDYFKKYVVTQKENMFVFLVKSNWKLLEQRSKHALNLWKKAVPMIISPFMPNLNHFYLFQKKCLGYYAKTLQASVGLEGVARTIQDLYTRTNGNEEIVQEWLAGFEEIYLPKIEEHYEILAWMIYPQRFFKIIELFMEQQMSEEECAQAWIELCHEQTNMDVLQHWYASRIDHLREDAVSI